MLTPEQEAAHREALDKARVLAVPADNFALRDEAVRVSYRAGLPVALIAEAVRLPEWRIRKLVREHDWPNLAPEAIPTLPPDVRPPKFEYT
jgi:hypothetical protein